ncbi:hypothetical protein L195_g049329, partial [Trifolium pratense]
MAYFSSMFVNQYDDLALFRMGALGGREENEAKEVLSRVLHTIWGRTVLYILAH